MRICVKSGECTVRIPIPTGLVLNGVTACLAPGFLAKHGVHVTRRQAIAFVRELNRYRRRHRDWKLVEVSAGDGAGVEIKL